MILIIALYVATFITVGLCIAFRAGAMTRKAVGITAAACDLAVMVFPRYVGVDHIPWLGYTLLISLFLADLFVGVFG